MDGTTFWLLAYMLLIHTLALFIGIVLRSRDINKAQSTHYLTKLTKSIKYFYSWFAIILTLIPALLIVSLGIYDASKSPPGGFFFFGVFVVPFVWFGLTQILSALFIVIFNYKFRFKEKLNLLISNFQSSIIFFIVLMVAFISFYWIENQYRIYMVKQYREQIKIKNISYKELDRNENGILDSVLVDFDLEVKSKEEVPVTIDSKIATRDHGEDLLTSDYEYRLIDVVSYGVYKCETYINFTKFDQESFSNDRPFNLYINIKEDRVSSPQSLILSQKLPTVINPEYYEKDIKFNELPSEPSNNYYPDTRPRTCRPVELNK